MMGRARDTCGGEYIHIYIKVLVGNPGGLRTPGRHTSKLEDNTKKYTQEI